MPGNGRGTPYAVTGWLRRGVAPLAAAARWERQNLSQTTMPLSRLEVEAGFLLALPLLNPPADLGGSCRMGAELSNGERKALAGATVEVQRGKVVACTTQLSGRPDSWAIGSTAAWFAAVIEDDPAALELGGDCRLARALLDGMHRTLFGAHSEPCLTQSLQSERHDHIG